MKYYFIIWTVGNFVWTLLLYCFMYWVNKHFRFWFLVTIWNKWSWWQSCLDHCYDFCTLLLRMLGKKTFMRLRPSIHQRWNTILPVPSEVTVIAVSFQMREAQKEHLTNLSRHWIHQLSSAIGGTRGNDHVVMVTSKTRYCVRVAAWGR